MDYSNGDWAIQYCLYNDSSKPVIFAGYKESGVPKYAIKLKHMKMFKSSKLAMEAAIQLQQCCNGNYVANVVKIHSANESDDYYITGGM